MKKLYEYFKHFKKKQWLLFVLIISRISTNAFSIYIIKFIIDGIAKKKPLEDIGYFAMIFLGLTLANILLQIIQNYQWHYLRYNSINYLRTLLFKSLLNKPFKYFEDYNTGDLITKVIEDGVIVAQHASIGRPLFFANILQLFISFTILSLLNYKLSLFILLILPCIASTLLALSNNTLSVWTDSWDIDPRFDLGSNLNDRETVDLILLKI